MRKKTQTVADPFAEIREAAKTIEVEIERCCAELSPAEIRRLAESNAYDQRQLYDDDDVIQLL